MEEYIRKVEKQYVDGLLENNHETFNYFDINNAFEAGFEISNAMHEKFLNKFLEKIGPFIQGLDADEIYDILQLSKEEAQQ